MENRWSLNTRPKAMIWKNELFWKCLSYVYGDQYYPWPPPLIFLIVLSLCFTYHTAYMTVMKNAVSALNDAIFKVVCSRNIIIYNYRRLFVFIYNIWTSLKLNSSIAWAGSGQLFCKTPCQVLFSVMEQNSNGTVHLVLEKSSCDL